jgi:hypothetical protein
MAQQDSWVWRRWGNLDSSKRTGPVAALDTLGAGDVFHGPDSFVARKDQRWIRYLRERDRFIILPMRQHAR